MSRCPSDPRPRDLLGRMIGLGTLPLRPATVRRVLRPVKTGASRLDDEDTQREGLTEPSGDDPCWDPGWVLARLGTSEEPLAIVRDRPWWPPQSAAISHALNALWRRAVATRLAVRILNSSPNLPRDDIECLALLRDLPGWALAAAAPEAFARLVAIPQREERRAAELALLGFESQTLAWRLAEAWGLPDPLVELLWRRSLGSGSSGNDHEDHAGLHLLSLAESLVERTPWACERPRVRLAPSTRDGHEDPRDWLIARVQTIATGSFTCDEATQHEARLARAHAALLLSHVQVRNDLARRDLALRTIVARASSPSDPDEASDALSEWPADAAEDSLVHRALRAVANLRARWIRTDRRLDTITRDYQAIAEQDDEQRRVERLDAMAEFAAGAGHELNNPLAVILGRAQLLLAKAQDAETARSLRAIIGQAQRASRILRDLMYVARPPKPRLRRCQPHAIARDGVDDLRDEAQRRRIRIEFRPQTPPTWTWGDPDALRHLLDAILRNAVEATPPGGNVEMTCRSTPDRLDWHVRDSGPGLDARSSRHLLDPFYCGREAGRGLGLGLARAARFVRLAGGEIRWRSANGVGTSVRVRMPLTSTEPQCEDEAPARHAAAS